MTSHQTTLNVLSTTQPIHMNGRDGGQSVIKLTEAQKTVLRAKFKRRIADLRANGYDTSNLDFGQIVSNAEAVPFNVHGDSGAIRLKWFGRTITLLSNGGIDYSA
jgi:hypothetical protein